MRDVVYLGCQQSRQLSQLASRSTFGALGPNRLSNPAPCPIRIVTAVGSLSCEQFSPSFGTLASHTVIHHNVAISVPSKHFFTHSELFYSNLKDVREDAKQEATRVATAEARVSQAFDETWPDGARNFADRPDPRVQHADENGISL